MASVLFSTVGQAIGGPLGAGIGAAVGSSIDTSLFRRSRRGAQDGFATRSAYGEVVPLVFGRTRVAGHLIWATSPATAGSKGEGRRAQSTSFAMAVSRGPIVDIGRIWADGSLLRNSDGDLLTDAEFRIHAAGSAEPDPLIVAAEGDSAPAYVHLSYIVFENFDLGPYGNRIPSMSFEVIAGGGSAGNWLSQLTRMVGAEIDAPLVPVSIDGYVARLDPLADDLAALVGAAGCKVGVRDGRLTVLSAPRVSRLSAAELVEASGASDTDARVRHDARPSGIELSFQDNDRDYQIGWQQELKGRRGDVLAVSWPAAATASVARSIALRLLQEAEAGADSISLVVPHRFLEISVGDVIDLGSDQSWLVNRREVRGLSVQLEGRRLARVPWAAAVPTDPGRIVPPPSIKAPPSVVRVMEPPVPIGNRSQASILISVSGSAGWAGADVLLLQGGDEVPIGVATESLPFGVLAAALGQGPDTIWDRQNELIIDIAGQDRPFLSRSSSDVLDGGGLLIIGDELLQYCDAEVLATGLVRLRGLLRGRFGTSFKGSPAGTMVMSVPRAGGVWFDIDATMAGRELMFLVGGRGDPRGGVPVPHLVGGAGLAPLAPVHLAGERRPDGTIECSWVERDRAHWAWESGPASMPGRRYAWHFRGNDGSTARFETSATGVRLESAAQQAAFGTALPAGEFQIEALGDGPESLRLSRWLAI